MQGDSAGLIVLNRQGRAELAPGAARGVLGCAPPGDRQDGTVAFLEVQAAGAGDGRAGAGAAVLLGTSGATESSRRRRHALHRSLSHDLRGVLNAVGLRVGLLREAVREPRESDSREDGLRRSVEALSRLQGDLLAAFEDLIEFTRPPGGPAGRFDLREACREAARLSGLGSPAGVEPTMDLPDSEVVVHDDRVAVRQTILEAILFALGDAGTRVHLRLESGDGARLLVVGEAIDDPASTPRSGWLQWPVASPEEVA